MNFSIKPITEKYLNEAIELHTKVFFNNEPLTPKLGISIGEFKKIIGEDLLFSINKGYSIGAFDNNKLIGFIVCSDTDNSKSKQKIEDSNDPFQKLHLAVKKLNVVLNKDPFKGQKLFHIKTMGVDESYVGHGIGKGLIKKAIEIAQNNKFKYIYAECTNIFSERGMVNNGFEVIYQYAWKDSGIKEFEDVPGNFSLTVKSL